MSHRSIENDVFFPAADAMRRVGHRFAADAFFQRPAPPREASPALWMAATPLRFGVTLFLVGWAGILFQAEFLQQVVFGAPLFEELAKAGPAIALAALLSLRSMWLRVPLGWASGAAFGVMEHYTSYATEGVFDLAFRIAFHAGATGLTLAFFTAFERAPDVRARWASTALSTLLHWANNFLAVVLSFAALAFPAVESVSLPVGAIIATLAIVVALVALAAPARFGDASRRALSAAMPRLGIGERDEW